MAASKKAKKTAKSKPVAKIKAVAKKAAAKVKSAVKAKAGAKPAKAMAAKSGKAAGAKAGTAKSARTAVPAGTKAMPARASLDKTIQPLHDRILVFVEGASERTAGGIIIPGIASERPHQGRVLAKGPGKRNRKGFVRPLDVSVGETVLFPEYAGTRITLDGTELLILHEDEVLGIAE